MIVLRSWFGRLFIPMAGLALLFVSCSNTGSAPAAGSGRSLEQTRRVAEDTNRDDTAIYATLEPEGVIYAAPLVVRGVVDEVQGPFWNSADGQKWTHRTKTSADGPADYTVPELYRDVTVTITDIVRNDYDFEGKVVNFFAYGGGEGSDDDAAFRDGHFTVGEEVLLFLAPQAFWMRESSLVVYMPYFGAAGVYHIVDGMAVADASLSVDISDPATSEEIASQPPESASVDELIAAVLHARDVVNPEYEAYRLPKGSAEQKRLAIEEDLTSTTLDEVTR